MEAWDIGRLAKHSSGWIFPNMAVAQLDRGWWAFGLHGIGLRGSAGIQLETMAAERHNEPADLPDDHCRAVLPGRRVGGQQQQLNVSSANADIDRVAGVGVQEMASRHRVRAPCLQIIKTATVPAAMTKRVNIKQFHDSKIKFPLTRRMARSDPSPPPIIAVMSVYYLDLFVWWRLKVVVFSSTVLQSCASCAINAMQIGSSSHHIDRAVQIVKDAS